MLIDLFIHECQGKSLASGSLCIPSGTAMTTALRLLHRLQKAGLVMRKRDLRDKRRQFIELAPEVRRKMLAYVAAATPNDL